MTELELAKSKLEKARAAGDAEAVSQFESYIYSLSAADEKPDLVPQASGGNPSPKRNWYDPIRQFGQGASLGLSDEIGAGLAAIPASLVTGDNYFDVFNSMHDSLAEEQEAYEKNFPAEAAALEIAGAIASPGVLGVKGAAKVAKKMGSSKAGKLAVMPVIGGVEGGIYGFGTGQSIDERLSNMPEDAATGAITGGVLSAAGVGHDVYKTLKKTDKEKAIEILKEYAKDTGETSEALIEKYEKFGDQGMLADIDPVFREVAGSVYREMGELKGGLTKFLKERQSGQQGRLLEAAEANVGADLDNFKPYLHNIIDQRTKAAKPMYEKAYQQSVEYTADIQKIMQRPSMRTAAKGALRKAKEQGVELSLKDGLLDLTKLKNFDYIKKYLDSQYKNLQRTRPSDALDLLKSKNDLLKLLDDQVPSYKEARGVFAGAKQLEDAASLGKKLFKQDADDMAELIEGMSKSERDMFKLGSLRAIKEKLGTASDRGDSVKKILQSNNVRDRLRNAFDDEAAFKKFMAQAEIESEMFESIHKIKGNSATAERLKSDSDLGNKVDGVLEASSAATGNPGLLITMAKNLLRDAGVKSTIKKELGEILTSPNITDKKLLEILGEKKQFDSIYEKLKYLSQDAARHNASNPGKVNGALLSEYTRLPRAGMLFFDE